MGNTTETDFLIVGQGLAGTLLSFELLKAGYSVHIIDNSHFEASTVVASGLINPITGRRLVKTEQIDELLPIAQSTYLVMEQFLGVPLWKDKNISWALSGMKEENDWNARVSTEAYARFMHFSDSAHYLMEKTRDVDAFGTIFAAAQVNISLMIGAYAEKMNDAGKLTREVFEFEELDFNEPNCIRYKGIKAGKIIFCEGEKGRFNPYFRDYPFFVAKGEVLIIRAPELGLKEVLKSHVTFCPLGEDTYWAGSNFEWNPSDARPTKLFRDAFTEEIRKILRVPFEVIDHQAAIRPAVSDRRPLVGFHPEFPLIGIFNGLGTKGTSLGPWWAKYFLELIRKQQ